MSFFYKQFGADYSCGTYGSGSYDSNQSCETTTDSGSLADTGTNVAIGITGGALLIVVAVVMIITTRRSAKKAQK